MARRPKVPFPQRYADSKSIARHALTLIARERDLWVLPIAAGLLMFLIMGVGIAFGVLGPVEAVRDRGALGIAVFSLLLMLLFLPVGIAVSWVQSAFAYALYQRMEGRHVSVRHALRRAGAHIGVIARFNILAWTVGVFLTLIGQLLDSLRIIPFIGRITQLIGTLGWAAASFFVIPVIVIERERSATGALRRSVAIGRAQFGKTVAGVVTIALVAIVPYVLVVGLGMFLILLGMLAGSEPVLTLLGLGIFGLALVAALLSTPLIHALQLAYQTVLYRYAVTGRVDAPFGAETVSDVWAPYRQP